MAAAATASSSYPSASASTSDRADNYEPKFDEYRSRVMLGDLPADFLRIQLARSQLYDSVGASGGYPQLQQQQPYHNPNFVGYLTLTIAEAKLIKNYGPLGLLKMDPYVRIRIGHVSYETPTAVGGGKNPQWKASYRINLFKGMDAVFLEIYDERNFTEDNFIGECTIPIPKEVFDGETKQSWYPLMGRQAQANENQGDILVVLSFLAVRQPPSSLVQKEKQSPQHQLQQQEAAASTAQDLIASSSSSSEASASLQPQHSPSAIPKPPPPPYTPDDVRTLVEMFPTVDQRVIIDLLDQQHGNKDTVVNHLLQIVP